jgi:hypothetical protein
MLCKSFATSTTLFDISRQPTYYRMAQITTIAIKHQERKHG